MIESNHIIVLVTVGSDAEAQAISRALISEKKAACVNIVPRVNSIFRWKGNIEKAEENLLIVKTTAMLLNQVIDLVKRNHSYEVPEIIALPIVEGNSEYLAWIDEVTEGE